MKKKKNVFSAMLVEIARTNFNYEYNKAFDCSKFRHFDDEFLSQFDGMYYNGYPIWYYLEYMSMGKCYDASAILALAIGESSNVARGELSNLNSIYGEKFGHGWVEVGNTVYDTTWKIIADKKTYYRVYGVKKTEVTPSKDFFERCKEISDWNIRTKEYYENNYVPMMYPSVIQGYNLAEQEIMSGDEGRVKKGERLKKELPDFEKVWEQYNKNDLDFLAKED